VTSRTGGASPANRSPVSLRRFEFCSAPPLAARGSFPSNSNRAATGSRSARQGGPWATASYLFAIFVPNRSTNAAIATSVSNSLALGSGTASVKIMAGPFSAVASAWAAGAPKHRSSSKATAGSANLSAAEAQHLDTTIIVYFLSLYPASWILAPVTIAQASSPAGSGSVSLPVRQPFMTPCIIPG